MLVKAGKVFEEAEQQAMSLQDEPALETVKRSATSTIYNKVFNNLPCRLRPRLPGVEAFLSIVFVPWT